MSKIQTFTGLTFDYLHPQPDTINLNDIAHALALSTRYAGHCSSFYSVGQHSVLCAIMAGKLGANMDMDGRRWALLHDATEAYMSDLPRPLKDLIPQYRTMEDNLHRVIANKFGLSWPMPKIVKEIDTQMMITEARILLTQPLGPAWTPWNGIESYDYTYAISTLNDPWSPARSERQFLAYATLLGILE